uniref:Olfactory receptor family 13 subfamily E member 8 n=1 Tax=Jaculus jaculus TaxID=51337 RepID=A0A8C5KDZ6_JACJA
TDGTHHTATTGYILLGLQEHPSPETALFMLCLGIYCMTLLGNLLLVGPIVLDPRLHSPMYFLLSNLSRIDICGTSSSMPLMLVNFLEAQKAISFLSGALRMYLTLALGARVIALAVMAYDWYVAICQPLRYSELVSGAVCTRMASILVWHLPFCGHDVINHFFCEILAVLKLACGDISLNALTLMEATAVLSLTPFLLICLSYIFTLVAILRVPSAAGQHKAFSTCSAHLTVVLVVYGAISFLYLKPKAKDPSMDKSITLFYGAVAPSLSTLIYSLRNMEVRATVTALLGGDLFSRKMSYF